MNDLELLSTSAPNGLTLLKLIDRTKTRAGREHLRRLLVEPLRTPSDIQAAQIAHQELAAETVLLEATFAGSHADDVDQYLSSNWQLPSARSGVERLTAVAWSPAWYRDYRGFAHNGRQFVVEFLHAARTLGERMCSAKSAVLRDMGESLRKTLDGVEIRALERGAQKTTDSAYESFDDVARGPGRPVLADAIARVGRLEAMWSLATAAKELGWEYPKVGTKLEIVGLVHPFLGTSGVPNDLSFHEDVCMCFVTGPNMGGKSTVLKAVAVATVLAQVGAAVPATHMEFVPVDAVFSSIQLGDSLAAGESFYLAEVRRIRDLALALAAHDSVLAILDEPFRGTNAHDAADATMAIIQRLIQNRSALVFIASHIAEVASYFETDSRVVLMHVSADVSNSKPTFDYLVRPGVSSQRLGMVLLRQEGVLDLLDGRSLSAGTSG